jgi:hypothetical protein
LICLSALRILYSLYLLKAEPEKQPLLANGSETTSISRQRFVKRVPATKDIHATIEVLFLLGPCKGVVRKTGQSISIPYGGVVE